VNGSGSRGAVSDLYIDGVAFVRAGGQGDNRFVWTAFSVDAIDQFQVQTSGYSAIYEGQGVQNYTVKQGGRAYHGSVYEFFRNTALDTWGFFGPANVSPITHLPVKPVEHSNEYGINLSGPLVPFGAWKDKIFFFGNYGGFRYSSITPTQMTFPTAAEQNGNFQGVIAPVYTGDPTKIPQNVGVFDPGTQTQCTMNSTTGPCRYRLGFIYSGTPGPAGGGMLGPAGLAGVDVIPGVTAGSLTSTNPEVSQVALHMQSFLPQGIGTGLQNNFIAPNHTGLTNFSTTERVDYVVNSRDTLTLVGAIGRQASSNPTGQTTAGRNVGPIPYNFGQTFAPKTAVGIIEEAHVFTPHLVNQIKYGYSRYNGPTFDADAEPAFSATTVGLSGLPAGAAQSGFPFVTFAGTNAPTNWAGEGPSVTLAENYTLVDNLQWVKGKHTFTFGGQVAWLLYNVINATGGSTPITLAAAVTETEVINPSPNPAKPVIVGSSSTGDSYASFLLGQIDKTSFTQYVQQEFGGRFRAISPYAQDNWKISSKLTLDLGLRYDFYPTVTEVHNAGSFFNPNLPNPVTGINGALDFTGSGPNTCNCNTPAHNYYKNLGPRVGLAYQIDPKTVIRASYGLIFSHGNGVGGLTAGLGTLGFSAAPSFSSNASLLSTAPLSGANGAIPAFASACGAASGPAFGTGNTNISSFTTPGCGTASFTGSPSSIGYYDPYLGGRAPEFGTYTLGFQHQWTSTFTSTMTYVGSQGHFLISDGGNARGFYSNALNPTALSLGSNLSLSGAPLTAFCGANTGVCPSYLNVFAASQNLGTLLKPFPFQTVSDTFGNVSNANYNALQVSLNMRASHGVAFMANYTWSRSIDDGGSFRTGYPIPAAFSNDGKSWAADRIERSASTSNQPQHAVVTGVWDLPIGRSVLGSNAWERAAFGGFKFSEIFQAFSGSPLAVTSTACQTNPAQTCNEGNYNPSFIGSARINGRWGRGITAANTSAISYIAPSAGTQAAPTGPFINPALLAPTTAFPNGSPFAPLYTFANGARTAPYGLTGPGNYQLDISLVRSFPLHLTEASRLDFRAEMYNVTNHTFFGVVSQLGSSSFGDVTTNANYNRRAAQLSGRIEF
jgi:hypothetical protein